MEAKEIILYGGHVVLVDEQDFDHLSRHKWRIARSGTCAYASTRIAGKHTYMHHLILPRPDNMVIDHINGNGLDNRRDNLRLATPRQNISHRVRGKKGAASKYIGVYLGRDEKSWRSQIVVHGKLIYLGVFRTQRDAARAYNEAARLHNGEFATMNEIPDYDPDDTPFPEPKVTSSGFRGVYPHWGKWQAAITVSGKSIHLGTYATIEEAAIARNAYITAHGLKRRLAQIT